MEDEKFDELARRVARPVSRRQVLKTLVATAVGGLFVRSGTGEALANNGNDDCAHFCNAILPPGPQRGVCKSDGAHHTGLCYVCGPAAPAGSPQVCGVGTPTAFCCTAAQPTCCSNATCANLQGEVNNCGACGNVCPGTTPGCCSGVCKDLSNDVNNCGACGTTCAPGQGCCSGVCTNLNTTTNCGACGTACAAGLSCCNSTCVNEQTDNNNCGACGTVCAANQGCCNGTCTDLTTTANCRTCGNVCAAGQGCCGGACTPLNTEANCGSCGTVCAVNENCISGTCQRITCGMCPVVFSGTCPGTSPDPNFPDCACFTTTEGKACAGDFTCGSTSACTTSADCPAGTFCAIDTFCGPAGTCLVTGVCTKTCSTASASIRTTTVAPGARSAAGQTS